MLLVLVHSRLYDLWSFRRSAACQVRTLLQIIYVFSEMFLITNYPLSLYYAKLMINKLFDFSLQYKKL